jgi:hypothetical protein
VFEGGGSGGLAGSVYENEPPGTSILTIRATGQPANKELEYYVMNVTGTQGRQVDRLFDMDMKLGILATAAQLDREAGSDAYVVEIAAIVANSPTPITTSITVSRVHDHVVFFSEGGGKYCYRLSRIFHNNAPTDMTRIFSV